MAERNNILAGLARARWFRFGLTLALAFGLALILLLIPITAGTLVRVPIPDLESPESASEAISIKRNWLDGRSVDLFVPFGAAQVYATNGLTLTKTAANIVDQGGVLTYNVSLTNETGETITKAVVTDPIFPDTTCLQVTSPPQPGPFWTNNNLTCVTDDVAVWRLFYLPPIAMIPILNSTTNVLTFSVSVDEPLPDGYEIVNSNYAVSAESSTTSYSDIGPAFITSVRAPNWAITKTVSSDVVEPGDFLTYTLTIINDGRLPTSGPYTVTDPLPNGTLPGTVDIQAPGFLDNNITVTWVLSDVLAPFGGSKTLTYSVQVASPLTNATAIVNQNYAVSGGNVFSPTVGDPVTTTVDAPATISITKTDSIDPVQAGDLLTYTITVSNDPTSKGPASGVVITDTLPEDVVFQSAGFVGSVTGTITTGNPVVWELVDPIPVGGSAQVRVTVLVTSPLLPGEILANEFAAAGVNTLLVSDLITTAITATNEIILSKSVSPFEVAPGGVVTYTITLTNIGNSIATVSLTDVLHPDFSPPTFTQSGITVPGRTPFNSGGAEMVVFAATAPVTPGLYFNQVITAAYDSSQTTISNVAPVRVVTAALSISKVANVSVAGIGDAITYTYTITNSGNISLTDLVLTDDLLGPIIPATTTLLPTESTTATASTVVTETDLPSPLINTAVVTGTFLDSNLTAANTAESVIITYTTAVTVAKGFTTSSGLPAQIGDTITYTYRITNIGTVTLDNITLVDDQLGPIPVVTTTLAPGQGTTGLDSTVVVTADLPGPLVNIASATGTNIIFEPTEVATATASVPLTFTAAIAVDKSFVASAGLPARIDDTITYTYRITNSGVVTLTDIVLTDDKLGPLPVVPSTLGPGQSTSVDGSTTVVENDLPGPLTNTVTVTGTDILSNSFSANAAASVPLTFTAAITIDKTASGPAAATGETITYTYRVTNTGDVTLTNVILYDDEIGGVGGFIPIATTLGPDESTSNISVRIINAGDLPGPIINTATVTGTSNVVSQTVVATDSVTVALTFTTSISLTKTPSRSEATVDDVILYTYLITNTSDVALINITLTDSDFGEIVSGLTLPSGLSTLRNVPRLVAAGDFPGPLTNTAVVTGANFVGTEVADTAAATVTLVYTPSITLDKTANVGAALVGETITYTYQITNTGNITLTSIVLVDDQLGPITNLGTTTLGANGGSTTGTATYTVQMSDFPAITNTATVTGDDNIVGPLITDTDTLVVDVLETLTAITATNSSPTVVNSTTFFTVTTNLSSGVTYTWDFGDGTAPGSGQFPSHIYTVIGTYTAVVTASNGVSMITTTTPVTITPGAVDRFVLQATTPQTAGIAFPITITAVDAFDNTVTAFNQTITVADGTGTINPTTATLVNGTTVSNFTVFSATSPALDTILAVSGTITGSVDVEILPNVPITLTLTLDPPTPTEVRVCGTAQATVSVIDDYGNPVPTQPVTVGQFSGSGAVTPLTDNGNTNASGLFGTSFEGATPGPVGIIARHDNLPALADSANLTVLAPAIASAITITVTPDTVVVNDTATATAEVTDCLGTPVSGTVVTFTIAALGNVLPVTATTNASGVATSTVTAGPTPGNTIISANVDSSLTATTPFTINPVTFPVLSVTKSAVPGSGSVVGPGSKINYEIVVANSGTAAATNLVITDVLDPDVTFDTGSTTSGSGPVETAGTVNFTVPSLGIGSSVTTTIEVTVTTGISGTTIDNSATISSDETNPQTSNIVSHQVITFSPGSVFLPIVMKKPQPDLIGTFTLDPPNPAAGQPVENHRSRDQYGGRSNRRRLLG